MRDPRPARVRSPRRGLLGRPGDAGRATPARARGARHHPQTPRPPRTGHPRTHRARGTLVAAARSDRQATPDPPPPHGLARAPQPCPPSNGRATPGRPPLHRPDALPTAPPTRTRHPHTGSVRTHGATPSDHQAPRTRHPYPGPTPSPRHRPPAPPGPPDTPPPHRTRGALLRHRPRAARRRRTRHSRTGAVLAPSGTAAGSVAARGACDVRVAAEGTRRRARPLGSRCRARLPGVACRARAGLLPVVRDAHRAWRSSRRSSPFGDWPPGYLPTGPRTCTRLFPCVRAGALRSAGDGRAGEPGRSRRRRSGVPARGPAVGPGASAVAETRAGPAAAASTAVGRVRSGRPPVHTGVWP
jgi:hypothetical protein